MLRLLKAVTVALSMMILSSCISSAKEFRAAVARVDITPPPGVALWGYSSPKCFRASPATGTLDPLYARVLVLDDGERAVALVALDLGRTFGLPSMNQVRDRVYKSVGIEQVFFLASHTHSGPAVEDSYPEGKLPEWERIALERISSTLEKAKRELVPATIGVGFGQTYIGHNRRWVNPDGTVKMLWGNPTKIPTSPVDPTVGVIRIDTAGSTPMAILVNYACHPVVFGPDNVRYSADYPGAMAKTVEENLSGSPVCFFLQGAAGDINPYMDKTPLEQNADAVMIEVGQQLGREAARIAKSIKTTAPSRPSLKAKLDVLEFRRRWNAESLQTAFIENYGQEGAKQYLSRMDGSIRAPVLTLVINDQIAVVGIPGEPFVDFQKDLRARSPLSSTFLLGCANDYLGYFPTIRAAVEGGYGANSVTTRTEVGAGEAMIGHALVTIYKMIGKLSDTPVK